MRRFLVVFEETDTGFSAYLPDLPGCVATGSTKLVAEKNIFQAVNFHLEGLKESGLTIPQGKADGEVLVFS